MDDIKKHSETEIEINSSTSTVKSLKELVVEVYSLDQQIDAQRQAIDIFEQRTIAERAHKLQDLANLQAQRLKQGSYIDRGVALGVVEEVKAVDATPIT